MALFPSDKQQAGTGVTAARRTAGPLLLERVHLTPVIGYLLAGTDPYPIVLRKVIEEPLQSTKTPRTPQQTAMHADGHHLRRTFPFFVQHVKAVFQIGIKLLGGVEPCAVAKRMSLASSVYGTIRWGLRVPSLHVTCVQNGKSSP